MGDYLGYYLLEDNLKNIDKHAASLSGKIVGALSRKIDKNIKKKKKNWGIFWDFAWNSQVIIEMNSGGMRRYIIIYLSWISLVIIYYWLSIYSETHFKSSHFIFQFLQYRNEPFYRMAGRSENLALPGNFTGLEKSQRNLRKFYEHGQS